MELPPQLAGIGKARLRVTPPDGSTIRVGRLRLVWDGTTFRAGDYEGEPVAVEQTNGGGWSLTMADGAVWTISGCGCGYVDATLLVVVVLLVLLVLALTGRI